MAIKHWFSLLFFVFICLLVLIASILSDINQEDSSLAPVRKVKREMLSTFEDLDYFLQKNGNPALHLKSELMEIDQNRNLFNFRQPIGEVFTEELEPVFYRGESGYLNQQENLVKLKGKVSIFTNEGLIEADQVEYLMLKDLFIGSGAVYSKSLLKESGDEVIIRSESVEAKPIRKTSTYKGKVNGKIVRRRSYEPPVYFQSQSLFADLQEEFISLVGEVSIKKDLLNATSLNGEIYLENYNKKLKYYTLFDDVVLKEFIMLNGDQKLVRTAYAEKLEGFMRERKIELTGSPKVFQGNDVITGNKIMLKENTEFIEVDDAKSNFKIK
jgi:lipopolysaccharide transport protein LptA